MSEAKPTPGVWEFRDDEVWTLAIDGVSVMGDAEYYPWVPPNKADWLLFADAGNTYNTTGLTPSQLVERVKKLEELLNGVLLMDRMYSGRIVIEGWQEEVLRAALSKARPNTAEPQDVAYAELPQADSWVHFYPQFGEAKLRDFADRTHAMRASVTTNACGEPVAHSELFEYLRAELSAIPCRYRGDPSYDHDAYWMRDKVEKLIDEAELIFPTASLAASAGSEPVAPEDYVPMLDNEGRVMVGTSHHYTAENIRALVEEYKALEAGAPEALERYSNSDHRTRAGVLWRVISALADEVPLAAAKEPSP